MWNFPPAAISTFTVYSYQMCMRATVSLSAPRQELLHEGPSPRATVLVEGLTNWLLPELENWHSQRGPRWGHVTLTLTSDLLTPKSIGVFLSLSSFCVWSMKTLGQILFELSRYNELWTDGRTDRWTDR